MVYHVPAEESANPARLLRLQQDKLQALLEQVMATNPFYKLKMAETAPTQWASENGASVELGRLPLTTRHQIQQDQNDHPPYGTNLTFPVARYCRLHQTSGSTGTPLRWLDTPLSWEWCKRCWCIIYRAAGLTGDDRLLFPFTFGPFIGFWIAFEAATSLGNLSLAAGGMTTTARLRYLIDNGVTFVCCTPTYALRMAEVADSEGIDLADTQVRALIVAGEPGGSIEATRARIEDAWGARVFDHCGMTEIGAWGFECAEVLSGMHVIESEFIAEVIDPKTAEPVPDGQPGELVLTNLGRTGSPLIRYRTGDQVRMTRGRCRCGRWFARVDGGILGRVDDMMVIRGNNVFPSAVEGVVRSFAEVSEFRLYAEQTESVNDLRIEIEPFSDAKTAGLAKRLVDEIRDRLHFKPKVILVEPGTLPRFEMKARRLVRDDR